MADQSTDQRLAAFTMGAKIGVKLALNRVIDVSARPKDIAAVVDAINDLILAHFKARDTDDVPARTCVCGEPNALGVQHRTDGPCISIPRT